MQYPPEDVFGDALIVAFVLSKTPMVGAYFVAACGSVMLRTSAISCIMSERKNEPLSVIIFVGRYACLVIMSMMMFAVQQTLGLDTGYSKAYLVNTSSAVMIFSEPPLGRCSGCVVSA